jgi:hypothetical protein
MALNNAAADAALDVWIASLSPAPNDAQKDAIRTNLRPLIRAIYSGIVANAVVAAGSMNVGGSGVVGTGTIT